MKFRWLPGFKKKQIFKNIFIGASALVLFLFFQNCSPRSLKNLANADSAAIHTKNEPGRNAEPYDGKPLHLRLVPGQTCGDAPAVARLEINATSASIIKTENACQGIYSPIPLTDLEFSTFSSQYVAYQDGVYTFLDDPNKNISDGIFTEAWCRAMNSDRTKSLVEFAVEWHDQGSFANLSVLEQQNITPIPQSTLRSLEIDRVTYTNKNGILKINLKQKLPASYKVAGSYYGKINGLQQQLSVECLMGGQFDPAAPEFNYVGSTNKTLALGQALTGLVPVVNKSVAKFILTGTLPPGLIFNPLDGSISGTSQMLTARQKFLVSALFTFGQMSRSVSIGVGQVQFVDEDITNRSESCKTSDGGCSLAQAVNLANTIAPLPLIIRLKQPLTNLTGFALNLKGDLTIVGALAEASVLDAKRLSNHFTLEPNSYLELNHLELKNGKNLLGGSIYSNQASLMLSDVLMQDNSSSVDFTKIGNGGAIYAINSQLEILNSSFIRNKTQTNGSGGGGGAIYSQQAKSSIIKNSIFSENSARLGGAIYLYAGGTDLMQITNCTFNKNNSTTGGAIQTQFADLIIANSSFTNNRSIFDGGAIAFQSTDHAWISQTSFDSNHGSGFGSAAIYWQGAYTLKDLNLLSTLYVLESKFTNQSSGAVNAATILNVGGEIVLRGVNMNSSKIPNCKLQSPGDSFFTSLGSNVYNDQTCPL